MAGTPKKKATSKTAKAASSSAHPKYEDMIRSAIVSLKERKGSSRQAIKKYIQQNFTVGDNFEINFKQALKRGVGKGVFSMPNGPSGTVKLAKPEKKEEKKETKEKTSEKKAAPKKATTTKAKKPATKAAPEKKTTTKKTITKKAAPKKSTEKKPAAKKAATTTKKTAGTTKKTKK
ncbi:uncharacterized protein VTP21DRAFT_8623 [Calcarisporiella thermophila]|uniref:uncharacterized protein n=1 Tax=Calcarisporiella thermophila TaxID=911321 RepID=UPI00374299C4